MQTKCQRAKLCLNTDKQGNVYAVCPYCRRNKRLQKILPDTNATRVVAFCRDCKREIILDICEGQCFESRCQ